MRTMMLAAMCGAMALVPAAANATAYMLTFNSGVAYATPAPTTTVGTGFSDTYSFTLGTDATVSGTFATQRLRVPAGTGPIVSDLDFVSAYLDGFKFDDPTGDNDTYEQLRIASTNLSAGDHLITVNYNVSAADSTNGASYSGTFNSGSTAAVPEAGTWAMFLLGFGAIGTGLRRRRTDPAMRLA